MQISLDRVRDEPFRWDETKEWPVEESGIGDVESLGPIHWRGSVAFAGPNFVLRAHLGFDLEMLCDRCLEPVESRVEEDLDLMLEVDSDFEGDSEHELVEDDLGVLHVEGTELDLDEVLRMHLPSLAPTRTLCRKGCAGLCPECGANRNSETCDCRDQAPDPRWAALAGLRETLDEE